MGTTRTHESNAIWLAATLAACLLAGCGGGGGGGVGATSADAGRDFAFGPILTRLVGTAQPPVASIGFGAVVTGVAGAAISSMVLRNETPILDDSLIAFTSFRDGNVEIYAMNPNGTGQTRLTNTADLAEKPVWSPILTKRILVGNDGLLGTAAGFLFAQKGKSIGHPAQGVAFDRGTKTLFAADYLGLNLILIDVTTGAILRTISVDGQ